MSKEIVYLNGELVTSSEAKVSVFDHGFLYGYALFETMRAYNGKIFCLRRHIQRLVRSAEKIGLKVPDEETLMKACTDTLAANQLAEARLRLTVSRGEAGAFNAADSNALPTALVTAKAYTPIKREIYLRGYTAKVVSGRRFSQSVIAAVKSANYLENLLARQEAAASGADEALILNENGCIAEASASNMFFVAKDRLVTPPPFSGILEGITRQLVLEIASKMGITAIEEDIKLSRLNSFNEVFLTNSVVEIMPLVSVIDENGGKITIGSGKRGTLTQRLSDAYREMVCRETA